MGMKTKSWMNFCTSSNKSRSRAADGVNVNSNSGGISMAIKFFIIPSVAIPLLCGCAMFSSWESIPPPGGCDQCHTVAITNDWAVTYKAAMLTDERNRNYFQTEQYSIPRNDKPVSSLEVRKVEELRCFECHRSPNPAHKERKGRFHH